MARSAIALVRISGKSAREIAKRIAPGSKDDSPRAAHLVELRDSEGRAFDRGLVTLFPAPASYTGEDVVEISCHGNPVLVEALLAAARAAGARLAEPGEFSRRAFRNGKLSLIEAEAVAELIEARTTGEARGAFERLSGGLFRDLAEIRESLLLAHALWTAAIDFPEQAGEEDRGAIARALDAALAALDRLAGNAEIAAKIAAGFRVAIVGAPNAGKSTIFNRLVGYARAIVTPAPGTTRDTVEADVEIAGLPVRLIDTAGLRAPAGTIEAEGIARALAAAKDADLAVYVHDASEPWAGGGREAWESLAAARKTLVFNKTDRAPAPEGESGLRISALSIDSASPLRSEIARVIAALLPADGAGGAVSRRQRDLFVRAREAVAGARAALGVHPAEIALTGVEDALGILSELAGESTTEEMLDRLFSVFCLGK